MQLTIMEITMNHWVLSIFIMAEAVSPTDSASQLRLVENQLSMEHQWSIALQILSATLVVTFLLHHWISKMREREIQSEIEQYIEVSKEFKNQNEALSDNVKELFKTQFALLDKLSITSYENSSRSGDKEAIYKVVKREIGQFSADSQYEQKLEELVNQYKQGVMTVIRADFPELKETDYHLLSLIYAGFSSKAISVFSNLTTANIRMKKHRFREKVIHSHSTNKELILNMMPQ